MTNKPQATWSRVNDSQRISCRRTYCQELCCLAERRRPPHSILETFSTTRNDCSCCRSRTPFGATWPAMHPLPTHGMYMKQADDHACWELDLLSFFELRPWPSGHTRIALNDFFWNLMSNQLICIFEQESNKLCHWNGQFEYLEITFKQSKQVLCIAKARFIVRFCRTLVWNIFWCLMKTSIYDPCILFDNHLTLFTIFSRSVIRCVSSSIRICIFLICSLSAHGILDEEMLLTPLSLQPLLLPSLLRS